MISSPFPPSDEPRKANDTLGFEDIIDTAVKGFPHSSSQIKKGKGKRSKGEKKKREKIKLQASSVRNRSSLLRGCFSCSLTVKV
jgi:hypothetical protein